MRRLEGAIEGEFALHLVHGGQRLAGFQRRGMGAVVEEDFLGGDRGGGEGLVRPVLVAELPVEDVVVVLAGAMRPFGLVLDVFTQQGRVRRHGDPGIDQHRQFLVFRLDQLDRIGRDIAVVGDDEGDFLVLEQHLLVRQNRLNVAGQRRHVMEVQGLQVLRRQHGTDTGQGLRLRNVQALDPGMREGRAVEVAEQHAGQLDVIDVIALALGEADVLDALPLAAHALELFFPLFAGHGHVVHSAASEKGVPLIFAAAY